MKINYQISYYYSKLVRFCKVLKSTKFILSFVFFSFSFFLQAQSEIKNLEIKLIKAKDTSRVNILNNLAYHYLSEDMKKSLKYANEAKNLSLKIHYEKGKANSYLILGEINKSIGEYNKALKWIFEAIDKFQLQKNKNKIAESYIQIGNIHQLLNNYLKSIEFYNNAATIFKEIKDSSNIAKCYSFLGSSYSDLGDYKNSLKYMYFAINFAENNNNQNDLAYYYCNLSSIYFKLKNYNLSYKYSNKSIDIANKTYDQTLLSLNFNIIGDIYFSKGNNNLAIEYYNKSLLFARKIGNTSLMLDNYNGFSLVYESIKEYKNAFFYKNLYTNLLNSTLNKEKLDKIARIQVVYETEKLEKENSILKSEKEIYKLQIEKETAYRNLLLVGLFSLLFLLLLLFNLYRTKRHSTKLLEEQKDNVSKSNQKLIEINERLLKQKSTLKALNARLTESELNLKQLNSTKDRFFSIISHDLRNPFASIVSFARILKRDIHTMSNDEFLELADQLDKVAVRINTLLENLLLWSRMQTNRIEFNPVEINLVNLIENNFELFAQIAKSKKIDLLYEADDNIFVEADYYMIDTVLRNLISNAIKFTNKGGLIKISAFLKNDKVEIAVDDNGVGISKADITNLFEIGHRSHYGTEDEKGSGLGLILCKEFIIKNGGEIWVESQIEKGSSFKFTLHPFIN